MEYNLGNILLFSLAASLGGMARYGLNNLLNKLIPSTFPWGIFVVNILGCFGFGLIWAMSEYLLIIDAQTKQLLLIGFMGAFTTFSSFIFDIEKQRQSGLNLAMLGNILGQILLGFGAFVLAVELVK